MVMSGRPTPTNISNEVGRAHDVVMASVTASSPLVEVATVAATVPALTAAAWPLIFVGHLFEGACSFFKNLLRPSFWISQPKVKAENGSTDINARSSARPVGLWLCSSDSSRSKALSLESQNGFSI
jgi:hypothetical protein